MATIESCKIANIALIKMGYAPHYAGTLVVKKHEEYAARTEMRTSFPAAQLLSKQDI